MGRLDGKVAFVTGAARGQGRSHAIRLAEEGADIIAVDLAAPIDTVTPFYPAATEADLAQTVKEVEALDRRIVATKADVRDYAALKAAVDAGVAELGRLDIVVANAGIFTHGPVTEVTDQMWDDVLDVNAKGVWHTVKAAIPHLADGSSVILIASLAGFKGLGNTIQYTASKHAVVGMMKVLANELGPRHIRVNSIHPNTVNTPMVQNEATYHLMRPDLENPTMEDAAPVFASLNPIPEPWAEPADVSAVVAFLASDESRLVSGGMIPVDGGANIK